MLLWIGGPFIVIFIAMAAFSYWEASKMIESATQREMEALAEYHAEEINSLVQEQCGILEGLGQVWSTELPSNESFISAARDFGARTDIDGIYMGFPDRDFLYGHEKVVPRDEFDATSRPWYRIAKENNGVQISEVFINKFHHVGQIVKNASLLITRNPQRRQSLISKTIRRNFRTIIANHIISAKMQRARRHQRRI